MKKRVSIAVTGGIGSGKSMVLSFLKNLNYSVFSCDQIYKELSCDEEYLKELEKIFPNIIDESGCLNRALLSEIVFSNRENLEKLNNLSHPLIMKKLQENIERENGLVFSEVPLLFEGKLENQFDYIIVVFRKKQDRINAVSLRDNKTKSEVEQRISNQFDYDNQIDSLNKKKNVFILKNDSSLQDLKVALLDIIIKIKRNRET